MVSGINSKDIIDQLIRIEERPKTLLQGRKDKLSAQKDAYNQISGQLSALTTSARTFQRPSTFTASTATSSNNDVLSATTTAGAAVGTYQFQIARLVTTQQSVTSGFSDPSSVLKAGTLSIELGGGNLNTQTPLAILNGGAGVRRGVFRITDRSGKSAVIDTSAAVSLDDVIKKINTSIDIGVRATIKGDQILLADTTGTTTNNLSVQDLADGHSAEDLGLVQSVASDTITGGDINSVGLATPLSALNDGLGVRKAATGTDFAVRARDGSTTNITLGTAARTVGDVITAINSSSGGKFTASLVPGANGLRITDNTGGGGALSIADTVGAHAATDLGIAKAGTGATLDGNSSLAGLNTVLLKSLKGGAGLTPGTISIRDRSGATQSVNLSGAKTLADLLDTINTTAGLQVTASLNAAGNGIQIADRSGGAGNLVIADVSGTSGADLGINGTFDTNTPIARGSNLQLAWINESTALTQFNGGKGVTPGSFKITNSSGNQYTISLTDGTAKTLGDVIGKINAAGASVTASVNANGDGLLLTDTAAGASKLKVENVTGSTAKDLNILGEAAATTIDGSFEKTVAVLATDTLTTVTQKIKDLGFGVSANIINDGSGVAPYRLSLTSFNSGKAGRVTFDGGTSGLDAQTLVESQDAAVFVGGVGSAQPLLVTSNTNQLTGIIPGVNLDLHGVSAGPVTLNVARDPDKVVEQVKTFVDTFNTVVDKIAELTKFDTDTKKAGLLLGESTIQQVQQSIYVSIQGVVKGAGQYNILADIGLTLGDGAKLAFDEDKFRTKVAADPEAVKNLFTQAASGLTASTPLTTLNSGRGVRVAGSAQPDFRVALKDGTHFDLTVTADGTLNDLISSFNTASAGKATVSVNTGGNGLKIVDNTTGVSALTITTLNGSAAALDLGIGGVWATGTVAGATVFSNRKQQSGGGFGYQIERSLNLLVDPVDGVIPRENKVIDDTNGQYDRRMSDIDKLVEGKRSRLERQFANMESVLAGLQSQQSALAGITSLK